MFFVFDEQDPSSLQPFGAPSQALEAYSAMVRARPGGRVTLAQRLDPRCLIESATRPTVIAPTVVEESTSKDDTQKRIALPGQFLPLRYDVPVRVLGKRRNDCPVVAVANILNISYDQARVDAFQHGWSSTRGMVEGFLELLCEKRGLLAYYRPDLGGRTVGDFATTCPEGVFNRSSN